MPAARLISFAALMLAAANAAQDGSAEFEPDPLFEEPFTGVVGRRLDFHDLVPDDEEPSPEEDDEEEEEALANEEEDEEIAKELAEEGAVPGDETDPIDVANDAEAAAVFDAPDEGETGKDLATVSGLLTEKSAAKLMFELTDEEKKNLDAEQLKELEKIRSAKV